MFFDALVIDILQTTRVEYTENCEIVSETSEAYHSYNWEDSFINLCLEKWWGDTWLIVHEVWHELNFRIKDEPNFKNYINAWQTLNSMSRLDQDFTSDYARKNIKEDFAETFKEYYRLNKNIPDYIKPDWIYGWISKIQVAKFQLMDIIVKEYFKTLTQ